MHPAPSIIFFTAASGAGYGLLAFAAFAGLLGLVPVDSRSGLTLLVPALLLVGAGLLASMGHLGHPERAWRAFSQWRSSWLSREGVAAVVSFVPALGLAWAWALTGRLAPVLALATILMAVVTVYCTAMIYASLKPIPRWHHKLVPPVYLGLGAASGSALGIAAAAWTGAPLLPLAPLVALALVVGWGLKWRYWQTVEKAPAIATTADALGLGDRGTARQVVPPHTERNYILNEMGFKIARKHGAKLRRHALLAGLVLPLVALVLALLVPGAAAALLLSLGAALALIGVAIERWLFFAEAEHLVMLYYGKDSV